ncbi:MAG TPA: hypothetical protein VGG11_05720 [Xanthobacteraceae bacterium]|jgi:hypothetical protein
MSHNHISKSKHWLNRAVEMREIAASTPEDGIKASMLRLANDYDKLAARAMARAGGVQAKEAPDGFDRLRMKPVDTL